MSDSSSLILKKKKKKIWEDLSMYDLGGEVFNKVKHIKF